MLEISRSDDTDDTTAMTKTNKDLRDLFNSCHRARVAPKFDIQDFNYIAFGKPSIKQK